MKSPVIILITVAVVAILGVGAFTLSQNSSKSDSMMKKDETVMQKNAQESMEKAETSEQEAMEKKEGEAMMKKTDDKMMADSRYVEYSKAALEKAVSNRRVLFFYASWCPTCRPADASFRENMSKIPEDVTLIRVNYNDPETDQEEKDLAKKYGITYQHTYVQIDGAGKEITKWNGGQINELLSNIK